jgi:hypothetical protein
MAGDAAAAHDKGASIEWRGLREMGVPHWSDDTKKNEEEVREASALAEEVQLREDRIIRAALPVFWQRLAECAKADADAIQLNFPQDLKCKCRVTVSGNALTIQRMTHPFRVATATCNPEAHRIDLVLAPDLDTLGRPENFDRQIIYISVLGNDLQFFWNRRQMQSPTDLSKGLLSFVCEKTF